ncbi:MULTISPECIES: MOSC domain-containing protein [Acetivibrio]|uniref:MOSC domain-containing protein n=1 Tax=Acetivibrio TaxID=35829 RepID=UPI00223FBEF4|nr:MULTISPECIES: MOSC domain-containing protein [Acetivibrio]HOM02682.1 MOSC domain-containing protein [Acetivibrio sp.]HOV25724.1 MOSC domain-containing protein [Pseudobacteroides sp.]
MVGRVYSLNISKVKGTTKHPVAEIEAIANYGFEGDAHSGNHIRQISLLSIESIMKQNSINRDNKIDLVLKPGDYAENITTQGIDLGKLEIGDSLLIGKDVELKVSKIGKECHNKCEIFKKVNNCIMPKQGLFAVVEKSGRIKIGDEIRVRKCLK